MRRRKADGPVTPPGTIGVICGDSMRYAKFVTSLSQVSRPEGSNIAWGSGLEVSANLNAVVDVFLGHSDHEWIFLLGDDHVVQPRTIHRLWASMERERLDACAAFVLRRTPPWQPVAYVNPVRKDPTPMGVGFETGVVEVEAVGNSGLLIRRRVFEAMAKPYFRVGQIHPEHYMEDVEFCERARALGFRFGVDLDVPMGHITPMVIWPARDPSGRHIVALQGNNGTVIPVMPKIEVSPDLKNVPS